VDVAVVAAGFPAEGRTQQSAASQDRTPMLAGVDETQGLVHQSLLTALAGSSYMPLLDQRGSVRHGSV